MDKLGTHIIRLLNQNSQVYLSGLGSFKRERVPASFDSSTNTFLAPKHRIIYNTDKGSSVPLINTISETEKITYEESERQLNKTIGSILLELNVNGKCTLQNFGALIKQEEEISFIEDENIESLAFYKNVPEIKLIEPSVEFKKEEETERQETNLPIQEFEPKGKPINWVWPIVAILTFAIATLWYLNSQQLINKDSPVLVDTNIEPIIDSNGIANTEVKEISDNNIVDSLLSKDTENAEDEIPIKTEISFEIIIASFGKLGDAEKYVENMNTKGYKLRILENKNPGNLYKISYGSFVDEVSAQLELNTVRETLSKDAWIYKNKNN